MIHLVLLKSFVKGDDFSRFHYNSKKGGGEISNFSVSDGEDKKMQLFNFGKEGFTK